VCAPAGYGKTIALAGWLQEVRRPWVWVNLDELDGDLVSFTSVLVAALGTVAPEAGRRALALAAQTVSPSPSQLSALLADDLAEIEDELVIVLDDVHLIREPSIHVLLSLLVRRLPPTIQLVIASREEPPLQLALLRGRGELAEVRADDLRFDRSEARTFVRGMSGGPLDDRLVAEAVDRSEGWAVGLRLLTLANPPAGSSETSPIPAPAHGRQFVDAYLLEEVLARQQPELQRFLTRISILDRFCVPLCSVVVDGLQPGDARRLLDETLAAGLFMMPLDDEQRWYRLHDLFRGMLRRRLDHEGDSERVRVSRLRASDWLASQRLWDEAATQAIDAHDVDRVTSLAEACLLTDRSIAAKVMLDAWTRRLPPAVVEASPTLSLVRARMLTLRGEVSAVESEGRRIEALLAREPRRLNPALLSIARGQIDAELGWVLYERGGADHDAHARVARALDLLPVDEHDLRGGAAMLYAITLQCLGQTDRALAWISDELTRSTALHPDYVGRLLTGQAYIEQASGRLRAAVHTGRRMVAHGSRLQHGLTLGWGHLVLGRVAYEWNHLDDAHAQFEAVLALGQDAQRMCSVNASLGLAKVLSARGQTAAAERLVLATLDEAEGAGNTFFVEGLRSFMAYLALASDDPDRAAHWLAGVTLARRGITAYDVEDPLLTHAHVLMASATLKSLNEALATVDRAIEAAEARHVTTSLVQGLALRAMVEHARGQSGQAAPSIVRALEIAEPGRFTRTFADLGPPLTELLVELASHGTLPTGGERVLEACRAETDMQMSHLSNRAAVAPQLTESLTWRELDVLQLMDGHHTNKEIAQLLGIAEETVKRHAANIYGKLEVKGRRQAVIRAYELGILHAEARRLS